MASETKASPISSNDVAWEEFSDIPRFVTRYRHLTRAAVGDDYHVGVAIEELGPGKQSSPAHYHTFEEEHVYILEGTVTAGAVEVPGGTVRVAGTLPAAGSKVTLAVRPEKMTILAPNTASPFDNHLPATLREVIYAGAVSTYLLAGPDGRELKVFAQNRSQDSAAPSPGSAVTLGWSAAHTIALED